MRTLLKPIFGVVNGEVFPREIPAGDECPPELEEAAIEAEALEEVDDTGADGGGGQATEKKSSVPSEKKATKPAENK